METTKETKHVLVIDDDDFLLAAIKKKLELAGYKVTVSNNVHDAYFKLNMSKPDLIMLDIIMPDINGIEFMHLIKSQIMLGSTPIVLMSYLPKAELYKMGYDLASAYYLDKPFDVNELPELIKNVGLHV